MRDPRASATLAPGLHPPPRRRPKIGASHGQVTHGQEHTSPIELYHETSVQGCPVVLLHGWPLDSRFSDPQLQPPSPALRLVRIPTGPATRARGWPSMRPRTAPPAASDPRPGRHDQERAPRSASPCQPSRPASQKATPSTRARCARTRTAMVVWWDEAWNEPHLATPSKPRAAKPPARTDTGPRRVGRATAQTLRSPPAIGASGEASR